ncbi:MAG TPA: alpha/beta fold hydrolase, partial [Saliniramus sp.]|nr:alpha/beta fold hydrolase [Saliniramus sp.]
GALNFVCIDHVVEAMMAVTGSGKPTAPQTIKAITGTDIEVEKTLAAIADRLEIEILRTDAEQDVPPDDRVINRRLDFFRPYAELATRKQFSAGEADEARRIYDIDLLNLVEAGLREARFGCLADLLRLRHIPRSNATPLVAYESHEADDRRPTTVIVNAYGMPLDVMHPLIHDLLASGRRVVSWDCRGLPDRSYDITAGGLSIEDQLGDWALIRDNLTRGPVDLIGWSTGAVVASRIAASEPRAVRSLVLLHGSYMHKGAELTAFQKNLKSVMPKVALSRSVAGLLYNSVFSENKGALLKLMTRDIARKSEEAMSVTQPAHKHIVQMLTGNPEDVFRYARLIRAFVQETPLAWLADITCPTLLVTGPKDTTAHPKGSYDAAEHIRGSRLHVAENGDHFSFYSDAAVRRAILSALDQALTANTLQDATTP